MRPEEIAKQNFATLLDYLQSEKWSFKDHSIDGHYGVIITFTTEDFPLIHLMSIDIKGQFFTVESLLDFEVSAEESLDLPAALMLINDSIRFGRFDLAKNRGRVIYSYPHYYGDNNISYDQFAQIISVTSLTVDRYNEKLFDVAKGKMTMRALSNFIKSGE